MYGKCVDVQTAHMVLCDDNEYKGRPPVEFRVAASTLKHTIPRDLNTLLYLGVMELAEGNGSKGVHRQFTFVTWGIKVWKARKAI